jgi:DNA-binding CsgD family transcriptional regulator
MARLSRSDLGQALDFLAEAERVDGPDPFPSELLDLLRELVGCDYVNYCELDRPGERVLLYDGCARAREIDALQPADTEQIFWRLRHQHPVCVHQESTLDFSARKLSDFVTRRQLHGLEIYDEFFRPYETEYELEVGLPAPPSHTKVFLLSRQSCDFTERERLLLEQLRPHLACMYAAARNRRVLAALATSREPADELVVLGGHGTVEFAGSSAGELMRRYFGPTPEGRLPEVVGDWLLHASVRPLTASRGDKRLTVRRVEDRLILREEAACLTAREVEVLELVAEGQTNAEIAATLWLSPGTVRIHLQHVYEKLEVPNRTAAVARGLHTDGA